MPYCIIVKLIWCFFILQFIIIVVECLKKIYFHQGGFTINEFAITTTEVKINIMYSVGVKKEHVLKKV